jgi:exodeoxyribonuclease-3
MKIASYNVNSIKARLELMSLWLEHRGGDIDVLCLQETKTIDQGFPKEALKELGFECAILGQKAYNGVAICSRIPLTDIIYGFGDKSLDLQKRIISAKINDINIINIYAPHGGLRGEEKYFYKLKWFEGLLNLLRDNYTQDDKILILGDFNVASTDKDIYDPIKLFDIPATMQEERDAFNKLVKLGLTDCFRHLNKDDGMYSWWSYRDLAIWNNQGMRLDYILASQSMMPKLVNIAIDIWPRRKKNITPSDHAPIVAEFISEK